MLILHLNANKQYCKYWLSQMYSLSCKAQRNYTQTQTNSTQIIFNHKKLTHKSWLKLVIYSFSYTTYYYSHIWPNGVFPKVPIGFRAALFWNVCCEEMFCFGSSTGRSKVQTSTWSRWGSSAFGRMNTRTRKQISPNLCTIQFDICKRHFLKKTDYAKP